MVLKHQKSPRKFNKPFAPDSTETAKISQIAILGIYLFLLIIAALSLLLLNNNLILLYDARDKARQFFMANSGNSGKKSQPSTKRTNKAIQEVLKLQKSLISQEASATDQAKIVAQRGRELCDIFSTEEVADILEGIPAVGYAFKVFGRVLKVYIKSGEVSDEVTNTISRISRIARKLDSIAPTRPDTTTTYDLENTSNLLLDGLLCVTRVMEERSAGWFWKGFYASKHEKELKEWNEKANQFLQDTGVMNSLANYIRISSLVEENQKILLLQFIMMLLLCFIAYMVYCMWTKPSWIEEMLGTLSTRVGNAFAKNRKNHLTWQ